MRTAEVDQSTLGRSLRLIRLAGFGCQFWSDLGFRFGLNINCGLGGYLGALTIAMGATWGFAGGLKFATSGSGFAERRSAGSNGPKRYG